VLSFARFLFDFEMKTFKVAIEGLAVEGMDLDAAFDALLEDANKEEDERRKKAEKKKKKKAKKDKERQEEHEGVRKRSRSPGLLEALGGVAETPCAVGRAASLPPAATSSVMLLHRTDDSLVTGRSAACVFVFARSATSPLMLTSWAMDRLEPAGGKGRMIEVFANDRTGTKVRCKVNSGKMSLCARFTGI
jgi:hypothetical protein